MNKELTRFTGQAQRHQHLQTLFCTHVFECIHTCTFSVLTGPTFLPAFLNSVWSPCLSNRTWSIEHHSGKRGTAQPTHLPPFQPEVP